MKHSFGLVRGKNDKLDARRILEYATRFHDKKRLYSLPDKTIASLKILLSEREMYVSDRSKYQGQLTDQQYFMCNADFASKSKRLKGLIKEFEKRITSIDQKIDALFDSDDTL